MPNKRRDINDMLDVSNRKHPSELTFDVLIESLIKKTKSLKPHSHHYALIEKTDEYEKQLEKAFRIFTELGEKEIISSRGVEWFLDNFFVIQEAVELIQDDLPEDYFFKLPALPDESGIPRIYFLAQNLIAFNRIEVVRSNLNQFIAAYQKEINLQMSELWALPLMLRLVLIEILAETVFILVEQIKDPRRVKSSAPDIAEIEPDEIIARCLRTLILFDRIEWKEFFEDHARVDAILRKDPADVYTYMDFETRDHYRKAVEALAEHCDLSETAVAEKVLELCQNSDPASKKRRHVGYFLIGDGRPQLKKAFIYYETPAEKFKNFFYQHATAFYLGAIFFITVLVSLGLVAFIATMTDMNWHLILVTLVTMVPASSVAVNLVNSILTWLLPPKILPKMDFSEKIPREYRTAIVVPALLTNPEDIHYVLRQLELHYLANRDRNLGFVLLSDFSDAPEETMPEDETLLQETIEGIKDLNERYNGDEGRKPFFLFHRQRQWNPQENAWIGWERKRGKLTEFNQYILHHERGSFTTIIGDESFFKQEVRFVITLDADTVMPRGSAKSLIATLAHPLNKAEFKENTSEVISGFTILQPRTEVKPTSVTKSPFTHIFAGDLGLDLYTRAVSNVYQDLFGEGIYVGKGIYDVRAFERSLAGKVPENSLLSHDLFEGIQGRVALVSDIVFFEDYPPDYASQVQRLHRWVRGDWQLLPWLFPKVPAEDHKKIANSFSEIDLWKLFDNLRRSLLSPMTLLSLIAGWLILPDRAWIWTLLVLLVSAFSLIKNVVTSLSAHFITGARTNIISNLRTAFWRWALWLIFLPYESLIMIDAIGTTLVRVYISHKRLLQWTTAAHTIRLFGKQRKIAIIWQRMLGAPILSILIGSYIAYFNPKALWGAVPFLILWIISPQIAFWISQPREEQRIVPLPEEQVRFLRMIARRTWLYFEHFVGPEDHWLPPDHFQANPKGMVVHRTSPTNIGLMFLSTVSAYDLGYIGVLDFVYRINYAFDTLDDLEKYRGHLLNWYDTQTKKTLSPRYVSTVDSGNYAVSLIGLYQALKTLEQDPICPSRLFQGSFDSLDTFCEIVRQIQVKELKDVVESLYNHCERIKNDITRKQLSDSRQMALLTDFKGRLTEPINLLIKKILDSEKWVDPNIIQDLGYWADTIFLHLSNILQQIDLLAPWMEVWQARPEFFDTLQNEMLKKGLVVWIEDRALQTKLSELPAFCEDAITLLTNFKEDLNQQPGLEDLNQDQVQEMKEWVERFIGQLEKSKANVEDLFQQIQQLTRRIDFYLEQMDFDFLFDSQREVFYLGYQVGSGRLDPNHYDLLASEARTASLFAIAKNEVPRSHWLHMSRPFTEVHGSPTLISWNGSMFEYLMPNLFTRTYPETLLDETNQGVVAAQIDYAKRLKVPWGISESAYYLFDSAENYQYKGFGVPGLGRKRGLADDLVISPYASLLAVGVRPQAVIENARALRKEGALGHFGFFDAIDYTPERIPFDCDKGIVQTYMAHHQGMILVALGNFLNEKGILDRVHGDPRIQSTELLLQEQIPQTKPIRKPDKAEVVSKRLDSGGIQVTPWRVQADDPELDVHILANSNLRMLISESGSGYLEWREVALTRWRADGTLDQWGIWFYIQDFDHEDLWSIGRQPIPSNSEEYQVLFAPHLAEIRHVQNDIRINMQTCIPPEDDVCIHRITLTNQTARKRHLRLVSYGEVALARQDTDRRHPAFNKLFIESDFNTDLKMLTYKRRKRSSEEKPKLLAHLLYDQLPGDVSYEADRAKFIGRGHTTSDPITLTAGKELTGTIGITLDPIFSLGKVVELDAHQSITLTFLTFAARDEQTIREIAKKYRDNTKIDNAFSSAESRSEKLMRTLKLDTETLANFQRLLSLIIFPDPRLRANPSLLAKNELGQSGLWAFGISGDYPILLVMIEKKDEVEILRDILLAHTYWSKLGLMIDLVILNTKDAGYFHELNERIHHAINVMDSNHQVNQRGGIFVLTANQMEQNAQRLVKAAAKIVLDLPRGELRDHLEKAVRGIHTLPPFMPTEMEKAYTTDDVLLRNENLLYDNGIGGFTQDGKEYHIFMEDYPKLTKEKGQIPPAPWLNVIANENFGFMISESGSGCTWAINSGENRLTPWFNDPISDPSGETLYLRDEITGKIWTPTPLPSGKRCAYLVKHGQGYTIFESINAGFRQELKMYAAPEEPLKVIELTLKNLTNKHRRVTGTYFVEWVLGVDRDTTKDYIVPDFDNRSGSLLARNTYSAEFAKRVAFLTTNQEVHGLTTDRREFLGFPGDRESPQGLKRVGLSSRVEAGLDPCAALQAHLNFKPGEEQTLIFVLGQGANEAEACELAETYSKPEKIRECWQELHSKWDRILGTLQAKTPDRKMDLVLNRWLLYQALSCRIWGRSALYQSGGAYGFRDQLQDITSTLITQPEISRAHILRAAKHQFEAGDVLHWWHPPFGRGVRTRISDDLLWLVYITAEYVQKTGDIAILKEKVPFRIGEALKKDEEERYGNFGISEEAYTIFEHCRRALDHGDTKGPHGLPLIGSGDWNDGMNRVGVHGKGESVWLAWFLFENHKRFADLCEILGKATLAAQHRDRANELKEIINNVAWDGQWFLRAFYDDGTPLGSQTNSECKIDSLPQSWSILTEGAPEERQRNALKSVQQHLIQSEHQLIQLFTPPFDKTEKDPGYIKGYPPGIRENGGQYTHAAIWAVWAETLLKNGDAAFEQFNYLNPLTHSLDIANANQYGVEPYVVAADIYSTPPHIGRGGWTWYTGSSGWLYRLGIEAILGFRLIGDCFTIQPCIPQSWDGYQLTFKRNSCTYKIVVENPDHVSAGVKKVLLDGEIQDKKQIPLQTDADEHTVRVVMG